MVINSIAIANFKSIKYLKLDLKNINILIGANGTGKSNFIQFFRMMNNIVELNFQNFVAESGGGDNLLFFGRKISESIKGWFYFGNNTYMFELKPTDENNMYFHQEDCSWIDRQGNKWPRQLKAGSKETSLIRQIELDIAKKAPYYVVNAMQTWWVYHFHDTSVTSKIKMPSNIDDNAVLKRDASNIASFLFLLQEKFPEYFRRIERTIKIIAPYFNGFKLKPMALNSELIRLEWKHEKSDEYFNATHLSDGTLRMICLITLLMQPEVPDTVIIDEPELGLHPAAINLLASLIKSVGAAGKQVICSTQSVTLLNQFLQDDIIVVDRIENESKFSRLDTQDLSSWLDKYSIGELWEKNVILGRP